MGWDLSESDNQQTPRDLKGSTLAEGVLVGWIGTALTHADFKEGDVRRPCILFEFIETAQAESALRQTLRGEEQPRLSGDGINNTGDTFLVSFDWADQWAAGAWQRDYLKPGAVFFLVGYAKWNPVRATAVLVSPFVYHVVVD